jgi:hypothetical protein
MTQLHAYLLPEWATRGCFATFALPSGELPQGAEGGEDLWWCNATYTYSPLPVFGKAR